MSTAARRASMRVPWLLLGLLWPVAAGAQPANVLLIVADDLGTDLLRVYGELRPGAPTPPEHLATPNLDALAASGLLFRNVWSTPYCSAARAAILTGRYGFRTGVGSATGLLLPNEEIIPRAMSRHGSTAHAAIGKWHVTRYAPANSDPGYTPLEAGFGEFRGTTGNIPSYFAWEKAVEVVPDHPAVFPDHPVYATTDSVDEALDWIAGQSSPWFLYLAPNAIHAPRQAPPDALHTQQDVEDLYEPGDIDHYSRRLNTAMLEALDTELGRLFDAIDFETTTVLFVGDNGTVSSLSIPDRIHRGGKGSIYEGGIRVPLIVAGAAVAAPPGSETAAIVHTADLFATVLELAGVPLGSVHPNGPLDAKSLVPLFADPDASVRETVYTDGDFLQTMDPGVEAPNRHDVAVRDARYKLIRMACGSAIELYDLIDNPGEKVRLALDPFSPANRPVVQRLWAELVAVTGSPRSSCGPAIGVCEDGLDGDGDGDADFPNDVGCTSPLDTSENEPSLPCDDGADNDGDGFVDAADPGCEDASDRDEISLALACDDGVDNDGDRKIDSRDPGCAGPLGRREDPMCDDGRDNDYDGLIDFRDPQCTASNPYHEYPACGLGGEIPLGAGALAFLLSRRRARSG